MDDKIKKICIFGIGGIGGFYGGKIADKILKKNLDYEVYFTGRGGHIDFKKRSKIWIKLLYII